MIRSRKPRSDDAQLIRIVRHELIPLNPPELRPELSDTAIIRRLNEANSAFVWVSGNRVHGMIALVIQDDVCFVDMLAVHRSAQGRGIGTQLLIKAQRYGTTRSCRRMQLYVNDENVNGIAFYQKHGMKIFSYDVLRRSYVMEKTMV